MDYIYLMEESLEIPVSYRGEELSFPCRVVRAGYAYVFQVEVAGLPVTFEPDEQGSYRAAVGAAPEREARRIDTGLLKAIAEVIESIVN
jgi:hypothetical protein